MARDAVIVSTARTPIGKAYRGAFNATLGPTLGAYALKPAIERAGIDPGEIDDVVWGAVLTQGTQFGNIGRQVALRAGCPVSVSAITIPRSARTIYVRRFERATRLKVRFADPRKANAILLSPGFRRSTSMIRKPFVTASISTI